MPSPISRSSLISRSLLLSSRYNHPLPLSQNRIQQRHTRTYSSKKMLPGCKLKAAFDKGEGASMGLWQCLPGANVSRTLARTPGIDWVMVDCEHGNLDGGDPPI